MWSNKIQSQKNDGALNEIYMESRDTGDIQDQATKIFKTPTIVPFRLIKDLIIEEIDD